ncbi:MAG: mandelate racemase/muconate lactonizing enzyme family protein [Tepidisphaeraceae bacterium]
MKITAIETIPVRVPIRANLAIKSGRGGSHVLSPFLLVKVHTDAGLVGLGEASCTPRWSGEDQFTAQHFISQYFAPVLIGHDIDNDIGHDIGHDPTKIEDCFRLFATTVAGNPFTKSAVEMALWDLAGKAAGKPVYELLGGKVRDMVEIKWSVSGRPPEQAAEIAHWAIAQGFKSMKVKVGIDPEGDLARLKAVRVAVGPQAHLGVDANGGWSTPDDAVKAIHRLSEHNLSFVEQPVPAGDIAGMAQVRRQVSLPLIADESCYTLQDAINLAHAQAADVFSIYVGKAGGIGPARRIAQFAESVGLKCTVGSNLEMGIGSAAMIHLALACRGIAAEAFPCDIIGPRFYEDDLLTEPLQLSGGFARIGDKPGLGVELDEAKVEKYRVPSPAD